MDAFHRWNNGYKAWFVKVEMWYCITAVQTLIDMRQVIQLWCEVETRLTKCVVTQSSWLSIAAFYMAPIVCGVDSHQCIQRGLIPRSPGCRRLKAYDGRLPDGYCLIIFRTLPRTEGGCFQKLAIVLWASGWLNYKIHVTDHTLKKTWMIWYACIYTIVEN